MGLRSPFLKAALLLIVAVALLSCQKAAPTFHESNLTDKDITACRDASLDLHRLTSSQLRGMVSCLNGDDHAIQPYEDLMEHISDSDLDVLVGIYNRLVAQDPKRFDDAVAFLDQVAADGSLKQMYAPLGIILSDELGLALHKTLADLVADPHNRMIVDPQWVEFLRWASELSNEQNVSKLLPVLDHLNGSGALSDQGTPLLLANGAWTALQALQWIRAVLPADIADGTILAFARGLTEPQIIRSVSMLSDDEIGALASQLGYLTSGSAQVFVTTQDVSGTLRMKRMTELVRASDAPIDCFINNGGWRRSGSFLQVISDETLKRAPGLDTERFLLAQLNLLASIGQGICSIPQGVLQNRDLLNDIVTSGHADGLRAMFKWIYESGHEQTLLHFFKSNKHEQLSAAIDDQSVRGLLPMALQTIARFLQPADATAFQELIGYYVNQPKPLDQMLLKLTGLSNDPQEQEHTPILQRFVTPVLTAFADPRAKLSVLFSVLAHDTQLDHFDAYRSFGLAMLHDEALDPQLSRFFLKYADDPYVKRAAEYTGQIALNGGLEHLVQFFINVAHRGVVRIPTPSQFSIQKDARVMQLMLLMKNEANEVPLLSNFDVCTELKADFWTAPPDMVDKVMSCVSASEEEPQWKVLAASIQSEKLETPTREILMAAMKQSPYLGGVLDEVEHLWKSPVASAWAKLFKILRTHADSLLSALEPIMRGLTNDSSNIVDAFSLGRSALQSQGWQPALSFVAAALQDHRAPIIHSQRAPHTQVVLKDPARMYTLFKQALRTSQRSNETQVQRLFNDARDHFENRDDYWHYTVGPYKNYSPEQKRKIIETNIRELLRPHDFENLSLALQQIFKSYDVAKFLRKAVNDQRVAHFHTLDGVDHVRFLTALDQMELLVLEADYPLMIHGLGVPNVGVNFQMHVAKSSNLSITMRSLQAQINFGDFGSAHLGGDFSQYIHARNLVDNFQVLDDYADSGEMGIFKILYRSLLDATPASDRSDIDHRNHMATLRYTNQIGMFADLTEAVVQLDKQGLLDQTVDAFKNLILRIKPADFPALRQTLAELLQGPLDEELHDIQQAAPDRYGNLKDTLWSLLVAAGEADANVSLSTIFVALAQASQHHVFMTDFLQRSTQTAEDLQNIALRFATHFLREAPAKKTQVSHFVGDILNSNHAQQDLSQLASQVSSVYEQQRPAFLALAQAWRGVTGDPAYQALDISNLAASTLNTLNGSPGSGAFSQQTALMLNPQLALPTAQLLNGLSSTGGLSAAGQLVMQMEVDGQANDLLHFVFDHWPEASLPLVKGGLPNGVVH